MAENLVVSEEQSNLLQNAIQVIKQETSLMKKCLETKGKLMEALKHASNFLTELRTSQLTPKQYYELYILTFDSLNLLAGFLKDSHPHHHLADLYELVQYAGNIVPRLYLMITVGTVYMSVPDAPVKEIMKDMLEMCKGVQYPIRGLFLRYYLSQRIKNLLPENQDSIQFVINNFIEMNKLWVRLQHQGPSKDRIKRIKEREEIKILVGSNLVRLSQLENDKEYYKSYILPTILEQIVQCKDVIAQEYLLDVVIQVFPDEFHLYTLDEYLSSIKDLNPSVDLKKVLITMIDRLTSFAQREDLTQLQKLSLEEANKTLEAEASKEAEKNTEVPKEEQNEDESKQDEVKETSEVSREAEVENSTEDNAEAQDGEAKEDTAVEQKEDVDVDAEPAQPKPFNILEINLFDKFWNFINELDSTRDLSIEEISSLLESISRLSLTYYPTKYEYIDQILKFAINKIKELSTSTDSSNQNFKLLLLAPIKNYPRLSNILKLTNFEELLNSQPTNIQKVISLEILDRLLLKNIKIKTVDHVNGIFKLLRILIISKPKELTANEEPAEFVNEQEKLAKLIHLIWNKDTNIHSKLLTTVKGLLSPGSIKYTYPALFFNTLRVIRRNKVEDIQNSLFKFTSRVINDLYRVGLNDLSLKLYLSSAIVSDQVKAEEIAYEFYAQAFTIYEESISDSRLQYQSIVSIAGALQQCRNFSRESYDTLITKTALHGSKLLKKPDQCRAVYLASHLWWGVEIPALGEEEGVSEFYRDGKRVLECLQRSLRVADACMDSSVSIELFVEILNRCLYYFIHGNESITIKYINGLIELIQTNLETLASESANTNNNGNENPKKHFQRTLDYINSQKEIDDRFQLITW